MPRASDRMSQSRIGPSEGVIGSNQRAKQGSQGAKKSESATSVQRLREAFSRPPANLQEDLNVTAFKADLPPKQAAGKETHAQTLVGNHQHLSPVKIASHTQVLEETATNAPVEVVMIDTCQKRDTGVVKLAEEVQPVLQKTAAAPAKTFDELNKPLDIPENQELVSRKITEFRESNIERFGTSQVPTPVVKEVYKQCAGGPGSTVSND